MSAHERKLRKTLRGLISASDYLTGAIHFTTKEFDHQKNRLMDATTQAEKVLRGTK